MKIEDKNWSPNPSSPVWLVNRIYLLHLYQKVKPYQRVSWYDTKQFYGEASVLVKSTPSLPSLPGLIWTGVAAPDRVLSMGLIKLFDI